MKYLLHLGLITILCIVVASCKQSVNKHKRILNTDETISTDMRCYGTFNEFAYVPSESLSTDDVLSPTRPWIVEGIFPEVLRGDYPVSGLGIEVMFARNNNGIMEIWMARPGRFLKEDIKSLIVYIPASNEWQHVPDTVVNTDVFISDIFLANDGTIWGLNTWEGDNTRPSKGPVLSEFNEQTQQFEFDLGSLEIPYTNQQKFVNLEVILDHNNVFWFLIEQDGIYRYDPIMGTTAKQIDLHDISPLDSVLSKGGDIYFEDISFDLFTSISRTVDINEFTYEEFVATYPPFGLYNDMIYQFVSNSGTLTTLDVPPESWPNGDMYVTQTGHLWFGVNGYKDLEDGSWHLLHPDPNLYFEFGFWTDSPSIILESSDGLLWFSYRTELYQGTAWYNPTVQEGCMFTNVNASIIEDIQGQLWMFANGTLFRYPLNN